MTIEYYEQRAKIYRPAKEIPFYGVAFKVAGSRRMLTFGSCGEAKKAANAKVRELHKGQQSSVLTASQALVALERLGDFFKSTGKRVNLNAVVADYLQAANKLKGAALAEAVDGCLCNAATLTRKDVAEAVAEFAAAREPKTKSSKGKRAQLSKNYVAITNLWLGWFAKTFPATSVCESTKEHLDRFMDGRSHLAAKSKNHLRATAKLFLNWRVKKDCLSASHRLREAPGMEREPITAGETDFYQPAELQGLLEGADAKMRPIVALQGLAGIRRLEAQRLTWQHVLGTPGQVAITATKSKTRQRRLVEIGPALTAWLEPYRRHEGPLWKQSCDTYHAPFVELRVFQKIPARKNGLRHGFCTFHFAMHGNENLTAAQAGNSPSVIHQAYKGLATKADADKWFNVISPDAVKNAIQLRKSGKA